MRNRDGYGMVNYGGRTRGAHRVAWELTNGRIGPGLNVCHRCDNRLCIRPDHLFLGTQSENARDMWGKGRNYALLCPDHVRAIRRAVELGVRQTVLAKWFGVSTVAVNNVIRGKRWAHVASAMLVLLCGAAHAQVATDIGTGFTQAGASGDVNADRLISRDNGAYDRPNYVRIRANDTALSVDPTCANACAANRFCLVDVDESAADSWRLCIGTSDWFIFPNTGSDTIADAEILVGTGANAGAYVAVSGDATLANTGALTVADDSHNHTSSTISGLDISADTNLAVTAPVVLTNDTLSCAVASGSQPGCLASADWTTFNNKLSSEVDGSTTNEIQNLFETFDASSGTDPVADSATDTMTMTGTAPIVVTGNSTTDTLTFSLTQNGGTDVTADLEEETHATEHSLGGTDPITVTNLASACTDAQTLGGTSGGTGVECQTDDDVPEVGDFGALTFAQLGTGTNTTATMTCGTGCSVTTSGSGTVVATTAAALAANPSDCSASQFATTIAASGNLSCAQVAFSDLSGSATDAQVPNTITVDLAAAATALASNPSDCSANQFATTIAASGNLTCAAITTSDLPSGATLDAEWDTAAEINTATTDDDFVTLTGTQTISGAKTFSGDSKATGQWAVPNSTATISGECDASGEAARLYVDSDASTGSKLKVCTGAGGWENVDSGTASSMAFSAITTGTNTTADMTVGSGAKLITTAGLLRVPNSATAMTTCTVGDVQQDTDAASGDRLLLCVATDTPVGIDNPFGVEIDASELANTMTFSASHLLDLATNDGALRIAKTTSSPSSEGGVVIDNATDEFEWYGSSLHGLYDYAKLAGRSTGQTLYGSTASGTGGLALIGAANSDGSDNLLVQFGGGGAVGETRGASMLMYGNEASLTGNMYLVAGNVSGAGIALYTQSSIFGTPRLAIEYDGDLCVNAASCTKTVGISGTAARVVGMERNTTAATAGQGLTINAGAAIAGTNNLNGGDLTLATGDGTGNGTAKIDFQTVDANQGTGSTARAVTTRFRLRDGHAVSLTAAVPTLSGCGTSPSITGTDMAGRITLGTGSPTACVVTFNKAYTTNAPACTAGNEDSNTATRIPKVTTSTTTMTLTATFSASDHLQYVCIGTE